MRTFLSVILFASGLFAQTSNYPSSLDTDSSLFVMADNVQSTLSSAMGAGDSTAVFVSCSPTTSCGFAVNQIVTICDTVTSTGKCTVFEHMKVTGVSGNQLTVTRGFAGTAAAAHSTGKLITALFDGAHHNVVKSALVAIETALGVNLANVASLPFNVATAFTPQTPGGSLSPGTNSITMAPCPKGVNGTDSAHYLYVSGGVGTAEAVLITGGTCTSLATTGTVFVTAANSHSGAWTIQTASGGLAEAAQANTGANPFVPCGTYNVYAPVTFAAGQGVTGQGAGCVSIMRQFTAGNLLNFSQAGTISGITTNSAVTTASGWDIYHTGGDPHYHDIIQRNSKNQMIFDGTGRAEVVNLLQIQWSAIALQVGGTNAAFAAITNHIAATAANNTFTLNLPSGGTGASSVQVTNFNYQAVGTNNNGIYFNPASPATFGESAFTNGVLDSYDYAIRMTGSGTKFSLKFIGVYVDAIGVTGFAADSHTIAVTLTDCQFVGVRTPGSYQIIQTVGGSDFVFNNVRVADQNNANTGQALYIGVGSATSGVVVSGGSYGRTQTGGSDANLTTAIQIGNGGSNISIGGGVQLGTANPLTIGTGVTGLNIGEGIQGISDTTPAASSAATLAFPINPIFTVTGNTNATAVSGLWAGRRGSFTATAATITFTAGATIGNSYVAYQNIPVSYLFDGTKVWLGGGAPLTQIGKCTLGTNCAVTFPLAYTSGTSYQCAATDQTAAAAVKVVNTSASVATFTGTGTDVISYVCVGN